MEIAWCLVLIVIGLIICFGGIYIKRICSAFLGLSWGAIISIIGTIIFTRSIWSLTDDETVIAMLVVALICGIASFIYDKLCVFINSCLSISSIVLLFLFFYENFGLDTTGIIIVACVVGLLISSITIKVYDFIFILQTAFTGAVITGIGAYGLKYEGDIEDMLMELLFDGFDFEETLPILIGVIVLAIIGFLVQLHRFNIIKTSKIEKEQTKVNSINLKPKEINVDTIERLTNSTWLKEIILNLHLYIILCLYICSCLYMFRGALYNEIRYLAVATSIFIALYSDKRTTKLWFIPATIILTFNCLVDLFVPYINIYLILNALESLYFNLGMILLAWLVAKLFKKYLDDKFNGTIKNSLIIGIISYLLCNLTKYVIQYIVMNIVPSEPIGFLPSKMHNIYYLLEVIVVIIVLAFVRKLLENKRISSKSL